MPGDSLEVRDRVIYINGQPGYKAEIFAICISGKHESNRV
jgi:hypothetical protein